MNFDSINDAIKYIEGLCEEGLNSVKDDMTDIMQKEIIEQIYNDHSPKYYNRTNELKNTPVAKAGKNYIHAEFEDNGDWTSFVEPHPHFFPMYAWEVPDKQGRNESYVLRSKEQGGGYYPKTKIVDDSFNECNEKIPIKFKEFLIKKGLDVK